VGRALQAYRKLFDSIKRGKVAPLYFLYGPEEYLKREFVRALIEAVLPVGERAFNLDILHGDEFDPVVFDDRVQSFGLFDQRRFVILRNFDALSTAHKDIVVERVEAAADSVVIVVESTADRLDSARAKRLAKVAAKRGLAFEFRHLDERETAERLVSRLRKEGFEIAPEALDLLLESVGTSLSDLTNEMEKIVLAAGEARRIDRDLVAHVVGRYRGESLFSLLDDVGRSDAGALLEKLGIVLDGGDDAVFVLSMLLRRAVQLMEVRAVVRAAGRSAVTGRELASRLVSSASPFFVESLRRQAEALRGRDPELLLANLRWADLKLKTTQLEARTVIEEALLAWHVGKPLATPPPAA
jgi:DNA polymerase-3 subunit delta